jgi:amino acid transporter
MSRTAPPVSQSGGVFKRLLVGRAVASSGLEHTLLPKILALPVFSSDALSSVAYATEEILLVLLTVSAGAAHLAMPVTVAVSTLMVIVILSYRETVKAYPNGGGAYIVSKENLGETPGLIAAAALLVDYMLTVVVSTVAGVVAITTALPSASEHKVALAIGFVLLITLANLRGVRESGTVFAIPTYGFILCVFVMAIVGLAKCVGGCPPAEHIESIPGLATTVGTVSLWYLLRAFSSGSTALTGVEAISNGVPAFRRPQAHNAATTLAMMGVIAISMFLAISWLATHIPGITVSEERSVMGQIAHTVFGGGVGFYIVQAFTAAILILAANTAFQDFPRLSAILARDRYMPSQFMNRGDRLVFSNGVIGLGLAACVVIYAFDANLTKLIQMYVVGVFTSFTLSQTGMIRHWRAEARKGAEAVRGWRRSMVINIVGAITTGVVLVVVTLTKFTKGAWLSILVMIAILPVLRSIHRHYATVAAQLRRGVARADDVGTNHVVLLVRDLDAATAEALGYIRSFRPSDLHCVTPAGSDLPERWSAFAGDAPALATLGKGRDLLHQVRDYVRGIERGDHDFVTLVVPEEVREGLFSYVVRNRDLIRLKGGMLREPNVVVTDVPVAVVDEHGDARDSRPLIPRRTVTLVFVSTVNDVTIRAVNYARSLGAAETRALYFDLDPEEAHRLEGQWWDSHLPIPLDVLEAPFRDLTGPMLEEVRRYSAREDTVVNVIIPEFIVDKWRHLVLHNQNAIFVKRLFLFEPGAVLTSVPFVLEPGKTSGKAGAVPGGGG